MTFPRSKNLEHFYGYDMEAKCIGVLCKRENWYKSFHQDTTAATHTQRAMTMQFLPRRRKIGSTHAFDMDGFSSLTQGHAHCPWGNDNAILSTLQGNNCLNAHSFKPRIEIFALGCPGKSPCVCDGSFCMEELMQTASMQWRCNCCPIRRNKNCRSACRTIWLYWAGFECDGLFCNWQLMLMA